MIFKVYSPGRKGKGVFNVMNVKGAFVFFRVKNEPGGNAGIVLTRELEKYARRTSHSLPIKEGQLWELYLNILEAWSLTTEL